jgi:uncharacterized protein YfiM (DUF2279 family)
MSTFVFDEDAPILVDFAPRPGVQQVALSPADLAAKSAQALDRAMGTIRQMARRVSALRDALPDEFTQVELEFGVKLEAEAGALISKVAGEGSINVTLTWERSDAEDE